MRGIGLTSKWDIWRKCACALGSEIASGDVSGMACDRLVLTDRPEALCTVLPAAARVEQRPRSWTIVQRRLFAWSSGMLQAAWHASPLLAFHSKPATRCGVVSKPTVAEAQACETWVLHRAFPTYPDFRVTCFGLAYLGGAA